MPQKTRRPLPEEGDKLVSAGVRFPAPANGSVLTVWCMPAHKEYDILKALECRPGGHD
ncbi:MAG: hypothetical protein R3B08_04515 [Nitrospira sp.]